MTISDPNRAAPVFAPVHIYDPDPAAKASALRDCLSHIADTLRQLGAEADVTEDRHEGQHIIALTLAVPCSTDKALSISFALQNFARMSDGELHDVLSGADMSGIHEAEYRAAIIYFVSKPPRARRRLTH